MRVNSRERSLQPDWMTWSHRDQQWLLCVWDSVAPDSRSMWVKLTPEQAEIMFAGLEVLKDDVTVSHESLEAEFGEKGVANGD